MKGTTVCTTIGQGLNMEEFVFSENGADEKDKLPIKVGNVPSILPRYSERYKAYFIRDKDNMLKAIFYFCKDYRIDVGRWKPYYESYRDDFDLFLQEFNGNCEFTGYRFHGEDHPFNGPGWYVFQKYDEKGSYHSDKYGEADYTEPHIMIKSLADIKARFERFLSVFEEPLTGNP